MCKAHKRVLNKVKLLMIAVVCCTTVQSVWAESIPPQVNTSVNVAGTLPDAAPSFIQPLGNGEVDWQKGVITATGVGLPPTNSVSLAQARAMAIRAAVVDARRNLLSVTKGVQIDASTTVQNAMVADDTIVERVRGFLQTSQILDTAYMSDGSVEVTVGMRLHGGLADAVLPAPATFGARLSGSGPVSPAPSDVPSEEDSSAAQTVAAYTGLLIDARGLGVRPAMTPRILTESGSEVYGTAAVSRDFAIRQGMAGYARDIDKARLNERLAGNPLVVTAVAATGAAKTDILISDAEARKIINSKTSTDFLKECRVMIVLD